MLGSFILPESPDVEKTIRILIGICEELYN